MNRRRSSKLDPILRALQSCERPLRDWLELSPRNAALFIYDPVTALREADLGLDEAVLTEIDAILGNIQKKIKAAY